MAAIERLRREFGKIPALLISADATCPPCEVGTRSYQLLYKPVNAERFHASLSPMVDVINKVLALRANGDARFRF